MVQCRLTCLQVRIARVPAAGDDHPVSRIALGGRRCRASSLKGEIACCPVTTL